MRGNGGRMLPWPSPHEANHAPEACTSSPSLTSLKRSRRERRTPFLGCDYGGRQGREIAPSENVVWSYACMDPAYWESASRTAPAQTPDKKIVRQCGDPAM